MSREEQNGAKKNIEEKKGPNRSKMEQRVAKKGKYE